MTILENFLFNSTLLLSLSALSGFIMLKVKPKSKYEPYIQGLFFGLVVHIIMLEPCVLNEGVVIDSRSIAIGISTLFFGPISGLITSIVAIIGIIQINIGMGIRPGILIVILSYLIAIGFYYWQKKAKRNKITWKIVYLMGITTQIVNSFLFTSIPISYYEGVFIPIAFVVIFLLPLITVLVGYIINSYRSNIKLNKDIKQNETFFHSMYFESDSSVCIIDENKRIIEVNDATVSIFGYSKEEVLSMTIDQVVLDRIEDVDSLFEDTMRGNRQKYVTIGVRKDMTTFQKEVVLFKSHYLEKTVLVAIVSDISNRKFDYNLIHCDKRMFHIIFDASPIGAILQTVDGIIIDVNETICSSSGYKENELLDKTIETILFDDGKLSINNKRRTSSNDKDIRFFSNCIAKDGKVSFVEIIEKNVYIDEKTIGILTFVKDLFSFAKLSDKIQVNLERTMALISATSDLLFTFNREGEIIEYKGNETFKLFVSASKFLGKKIYEVLPEEIGYKTLELIHQTLESKTITEYTYSLNVNNKQMYFDAKLICCGENEVLSIVRDVTILHTQNTELEQKNRFIETLIDSLPNPIFYMNKEGVYLGSNKSFRNLFQLEVSDIIGKNVADLTVSSKESQKYNESDLRILKGIDSYQEFERVLVLPNGRTINTIFSKKPILDSTGEIAGLICSIFDITDTKKIERELIAAKEKAEESDMLKTAFINNLSHEIRTPMNAILGFAELLITGESEDERAQYFEIMRNNGDLLLSMIDDILAVSRLEANYYNIEKEIFDIENLFVDLFHSYQTNAKQKSLVLKYLPVSEDLSSILFADKMKIRQIFSEFINNAIKYTTEGNITFGCELLNENKIRFFVTDTGIGISEDEQDKIFERFYRTKDILVSDIRGSGLGLNVAKGVVELLGGSIGLKSKKGIGSTFYFDLDFSLLEAPKNMLKEVQPKDLRKLEYKKIRMLVVDDETDNYLYLEAALRGKISRINHAHNGKEAIEILENEKFDCVMMDLRMPIMDGFEAVRIIRKDFPNIVIIGTSAFDLVNAQVRSLDVGCNSFLPKPFSIHQLDKILKQYLN